jgi:hypothetical protein
MALPGQFVIFLAKCIHGSHPNIRADKRVGLATRYVSSVAKKLTPGRSGAVSPQNAPHRLPIRWPPYGQERQKVWPAGSA